MHDAHALGWNVSNPNHSWEKLVEAVGEHVQKLNFKYRVGLKNKNGAPLRPK